MTSLEQCFMLEASVRLTFQMMYAIYSSGFTRKRQSLVAARPFKSTSIATHH